MCLRHAARGRRARCGLRASSRLLMQCTHLTSETSKYTICMKDASTMRVCKGVRDWTAPIGQYCAFA
eukprot:6205426-Pleurochrysis_carterae.AAC.3